MFLGIFESPKPLLYDKRSLKSILSIQRERPGKECENYENLLLAGFIQRGLHMLRDLAYMGAYMEFRFHIRSHIRWVPYTYTLRPYIYSGLLRSPSKFPIEFFRRMY